MKKGRAVGIDLRAIRNRDQTGIRCVAVAACPYPPSEVSCEAGARCGVRSRPTEYSTYNRIEFIFAIAIRL